MTKGFKTPPTVSHAQEEKTALKNHYRESKHVRDKAELLAELAQDEIEQHGGFSDYNREFFERIRGLNGQEKD